MRTISIKDYFYSLSRGSFVESFKLIIVHAFKQLIFKFLSFLFLFTIKKKIDQDNISRIVIYFPMTSGIGDIIMSSPFFKNIREKFPHSKIYIFTKFGIFINKIYFDEIIDISQIKLNKQILMIKELKIDLLLLPEKSIKSSLLFYFCHSRFKLGYLSSFALKANFKIDVLKFIPHKQHYFYKSYNLIKALQNDSSDNYPVYTADLSFLNFPSINTNFEYILFIPCVRWNNRSISYEDSKNVVKEILKSPYKIYLGTGAENLVTSLKLIEEFAEYSEKIIFREKLSLLEFVEVVKNSKAVICGDTGPMHMAFGFQKPVLSYWGPTFPSLRIPDVVNMKSKVIFEKQFCKVVNCYNMEYKPFCKTCLRLDNIPDFSKKISVFLQSL